MEEQKRAARVQDQIVNVARSDHKQILQGFHKCHGQKRRWQKEIPSFLCGKKVGQKKRQGEECHKISQKIQKRVIGINVATQKAFDVNVVDAAQGNQIDKSMIVGASRLLNGVVDRVCASSHGGIQKSQGEQEVGVKEKKEEKELF